MLRPERVRRHDVDVFHLQFGFDACGPEELAELVTALRETCTPYVHTVHDLCNPHHASRTVHDAQLDVLLPAADAVVTLTPGAAARPDLWVLVAMDDPDLGRCPPTPA